MPSGTPNTGPAFRPRIEPITGPAPYNPRFYFIVAFFGGALALGIVAYHNLARLGPNRAKLRPRTMQIIGILAVVVVAFLFLSPASWWSASRNIRITIQVLAVLASVAMTKLHEPAAVSMQVRHGDYTSMWKAILPILIGAVAQGVLSAAVGAARGLVL